MKQHHCKGFTLIELAISLCVVAVITAIGISSVKVFLQNKIYREAKGSIEEARIALLGYAQSHGRLPCPDSNNDGYEDINTTCKSFAGMIQLGLLPYKTLGLPAPHPETTQNMGIRYSVSSKFVSTSTFNIAAEGDVEISDHTKTVAPKTSVAFALWWPGADMIDNSKGPTPSTVYVESIDFPSDDIVIWESRYTLFGRMIQTGWQPR